MERRYGGKPLEMLTVTETSSLLVYQALECSDSGDGTFHLRPERSLRIAIMLLRAATKLHNCHQ
jgi:hypothetical protein